MALTCPPTLAIVTEEQEATCRRELRGLRFHRSEPACGFSNVFGAYTFGEIAYYMNDQGQESGHLIPTAGSAYTASGAAWAAYMEESNEH